MFPLTITLHNQKQLAAVMHALSGEAPAPSVGVTADEKAAVVGNAPTPAAAKPAGKPAATKPTATAEAAPAVQPTKPAAAADTTPPADAPFAYETLRKLVLKLLPTHADQLNAIAAKHGQPHGATTFKTLPPECWEAAYADVQALENAGV